MRGSKNICSSNEKNVNKGFYIFSSMCILRFMVEAYQMPRLQLQRCWRLWRVRDSIQQLEFFFFYWSSAWCLNVRQPTKCLQRKEDKKCVLPARKPLIMLFVMSQNKIKRLLWSGEHESLPVLRGIKTNTTTLTELDGEREQEREGGRVRQGGLLREERSF